MSEYTLPKKACQNCSRYACEGMGEYGTWPYDEYCRLFDAEPEEFKKISGIIIDPRDDEDFPYEKAPPCFRHEFWLSPFAEEVDGSEESLERAYEKFDKFLAENT